MVLKPHPRCTTARGIGELSLAQHAMLAGVPKAPSRINPVSNPDAGRQRRDWILGRMYELGYILPQNSTRMH